MEIIRKRKKRTNLDLCPTGCTMIDLSLGGGLPWGQQVNIVGDRSAGKTVLACEILACAKKIYGDKLKFVYDDAENGFMLPTETMFNLHIRNKNDYKSETIEELEESIENAVKVLKSDERLIYIVDTVEGLQSEAEKKHKEKSRKARKEGKEESGTYGVAKAKYMNQLLRSSFLADERVMTIFISQTRDKIGVTFGSVKTRQCERALEYWCDVILYLRVASKTKKTIGKRDFFPTQTIEAVIKKNKIIGYEFNPYIRLTTGLGIDDVDTNVCFLFDLFEPKGAVSEKIKVNFDGEDFGSRQRLLKHVEEHDLEDSIKYECEKKWKEIIEKLSPIDRKKRY